MKNERGFTLIETLAVIVISALILVVTTAIIVSSIKNYERISDENELRDEADILMSQLYKEIYSLKETQIKDPTSGSTYIELTDEKCPTKDCYLGFKENKFYIGKPNTAYTIANNSISIVNGSVKKVATLNGAYEIKVTLKMKSKATDKEFENVVRSINDK